MHLKHQTWKWRCKHRSKLSPMSRLDKKHMEAKELEDASKPYLEATETPNMDANEQANLQAVAIAQAT